MQEVTPERPGPVIGLDWDNETVLGRSQTSIEKGALDPQEFYRYLPVFVNKSLQMQCKVNVDEDGVDVRIKDPFGTCLLEWRFEFISAT